MTGMTNQETRFWMVSGILLAALVAIFVLWRQIDAAEARLDLLERTEADEKDRAAEVDESVISTEGLDAAIIALENFATATIDFTAQIDDTLQIDTEIVIDRDFTVPIDTSFPIEETFETTITIDSPLGPDIDVDVEVPVSVEVPIKLEFEIPINETIPVSATVPVDIHVPIAIAVADTELGVLADALAEGLRSVREAMAAP